MRPAVTVVVISGDDSRKAELETTLSRIHPEIPVVDLGGLAVSEALALPAVAGSDFLWFLTPDSRPAPGCLDELLDAMSAADSVAAVGPKLFSGERIVSAGVTTTSAGVRVNPVGAGELDQGQRDGESETLALDLPGMLIATADLDRIGAPSRGLGPAYRGIEYSRRLRDLGRRVALAPGARLDISSAEAAQLGTSAKPPASRAQVRTEQRYRLSLARPGLVPLLITLTATQLGAGLLSLLGNDVRTAGWRFAALVGLPADVRATARLRRANAKRGRRSTAHLDSLFADPEELAVHRRSMAAGSGGTGSGDGDGDHDSLDESDLNQVGDTEEAIDSFSRLEVSGGAGIFTHPLFFLILAAGLLSGLVSHRLVGPGHLVGGALGSTDIGYGELVTRLLGGFLDAGTGLDTPADPLQLVLAVLALPFLGNLDVTVRVLILAAPIAAAIAAYACAGILVSRTWVRGFAGLLWLVAPLFVMGLTTGRLGVILVWIAAPLFIIALTRSLRTGSVSAAAAAGMLLVVIIAGIPLMLVVGLVLTVALVLRRRGLRHLWLLVPTLALTWPWLVGVIAHPGTLFTMPGQTLSPGTAPSYLLAVGFPAPLDPTWLSGLLAPFGVGGVSQLWALFIVLPMLLLAFLTLIEARIPLPVLTWAVGLYLAGLVVSIVQAHLPAQVGPFALVGSYPAAGVTLTSIGAIALLVLGADRLTAAPRSVSLVPLRVLTGLVAVAAVGLAVLGTGPASEAVSTTEDGAVPALAADRAAGPTEARTLRLDAVDGEVLATLLSTADGTVIGTSTVASAEAVGGPPWQRRPLPIGEDDILVAQAAAALSADDAGDVRELLGRLGVDFVLVDEDDAALRSSVAAATGLIEVGPTEAGVLWNVDKPYSGRFLVREPDGTLSTAPRSGESIDIGPGADGRTLVVAEAAHGMTASIGGEDLPRPAEPDQSWDEEFTLPAAGGTVELDDSSPLMTTGVIAGWVVGLLCLIVALPIGSRRPTPNRTVRRAVPATARGESGVADQAGAPVEPETADQAGAPVEPETSEQPATSGQTATSKLPATSDQSETSEDPQPVAPTRRGRRAKPARRRPAGRRPATGSQPGESTPDAESSDHEGPSQQDAEAQGTAPPGNRSEDTHADDTPARDGSSADSAASDRSEERA